MSKPEFVYVTVIKTTPEKLWSALTDPEMMKQYWFGAYQETTWKAGAPWKLLYSDGRVTDSGEIIEVERPKRIVIKWRNEWKSEFNAEGYSRCTMQIEPVGDAVKLTVTHTIDRKDSKFIGEGVSNGWPLILSNLKSLLETGDVVLKNKP
jgi:uncharacterized protein YndB with AHSA1/START domain